MGRGAVVAVVALMSACGGQVMEQIDESGCGATSSALSPNATVGEVITQSCTTGVVLPLAKQLVDEMNCIQSGWMAPISGLPNVTLAPVVLPYLQTPAAKALERAAATGTRIQINSALRTLPQQYLLYSWYQRGLCTQVVSLAAPPGRSNHEGGRAIDVADATAKRPALEAEGYRWLGSNDPVHFDYTAAEDLRELSVLAFQRLWNLNHPTEKLVEDGDFGPKTTAALERAPAGGFPKGSTCAMAPGPTPPADMMPPIAPVESDCADGGMR
jgi:hypothetical protein